jgi:hypothetical protein
LGLRQTAADFISNPDDTADAIAGMILSAPVHPRATFLSLLLNGAFDADKLDYMSRDCLMAGVPCAVDVGRLIEKIHCVRVPPHERNELLGAFRKWAGIGEEQEILVLALPRSAEKVLEELAMTRTVLYDKIYFHQKVRVLELMVLSLMREKGALTLKQWLMMSDEALLNDSSNRAEALRNRRTLKRAFFISPPPISEEDSPEDKAWRKLQADVDSGKLPEFVIRETKNAARILGISETVVDKEPPSVDFPPLEALRLDSYAFVGDGYADLHVPKAAERSQRSEIGKLLAKGGGFVFSTYQLRVPSYFAARKVLSSIYKVELSPEAHGKTKLDPALLESAQMALAEKGFFGTDHEGEVKDFETGIRSQRISNLEQFLRTAWQRILDLSTRFGPYQSPSSPPLSATFISDFLRKFETVSMSRIMLKVLERVDFKDRRFFANALRFQLAHAVKAYAVDCICPLGSTGDSSALLNYFMNDLPAELRLPVKPLELALESDHKSLLLWDDLCGKGGHSITTLSQWLGKPVGKPTVLLNETLVAELSTERKERFHISRVTLGFALAYRTGIDNLREALRNAGMASAEILEPYEWVPEKDQLFSGESPSVLSADEIKDIVPFLRTISRTILKEKGWEAEKLEDRLLGYGNSAKLLVFFYNVPTITLTPLWFEPKASGARWVPLFSRREKPSASV